MAAPNKKMTSEELRAKPREDRDKILKRMRDKDREKVKGIFKNYEVPGGSLSFCLRIHKGDKVERYDMVDGGIYTIPLGVAKHLNKNGWYPVHAYKQNDTGGPLTQQIGKKISRFGFQSLEFIDTDDLTQTGEPVVYAP